MTFRAVPGISHSQWLEDEALFAAELLPYLL
jgi:hypothetical protein